MFGKSPKSGAPSRRQPAERAGGTPSSKKSNVFSYYASGSGAGRPKPAEPKGSLLQRQWVRNLPSLIALIVVVVSVLYCLGLTTNPKVNFVGNDEDVLSLRTKQDYQAGAEDILRDSVFNRTKFTINADHFEQAFQAKFPEVADVSITLPLISRRPIVTVATAQPSLLLTSQNQIYVLDTRGVAIMKADSLPEKTKLKLPTVNDQTGLKVELGKPVLPQDDIRFITEVLTQLKAKGLSVQTVTLPALAKQVDVSFNGLPYYGKFSVDTNAREAAGTFLATKEKLDRDKTPPAQYIDVRLSGRAYYQ